MRRLAFTICSNNFLSQATTLADSLLAKNPDHEVVIGLADKRSEAIDYSRFRPCRIVSIDELNIPNLPWMISNYNIVELNTAVKPYFFEFLFGQANVSHVLFFDPDICVYDSLIDLTAHFQNYDILLTPHVIQPIPKGVYPWENHFLKHGIYNLGFIGLKNTPNVHSLLKWWQERTAEHCLADFRKGLYVDQLWANFIPLFFEKVTVIKHPGMNVAFWNLHERNVTYVDGRYAVNGRPLVFFHFSAFNPNSRKLLTKKDYSNFDQEKMPDLRDLLDQYRQALIDHDYEFFSQQPFAYSRDSEIASELNNLTQKVARAEVILSFLGIRLIKKERLMSYVYDLFANYMRYNNLTLKNVNDDRYDSFEYAYHVRKNLHSRFEQETKGGWFTRLKLLGWSFKAFWK